MVHLCSSILLITSGILYHRTYPVKPSAEESCVRPRRPGIVRPDSRLGRYSVHNELPMTDLLHSLDVSPKQHQDGSESHVSILTPLAPFCQRPAGRHPTSRKERGLERFIGRRIAPVSRTPVSPFRVSQELGSWKGVVQEVLEAVREVTNGWEHSRTRLRWEIGRPGGLQCAANAAQAAEDAMRKPICYNSGQGRCRGTRDERCLLWLHQGSRGSSHGIDWMPGKGKRPEDTQGQRRRGEGQWQPRQMTDGPDLHG